VETTSPTMTATAQAPSAMPTGFAQASVAPPVMNVASPSQASPAPQQAVSYQATSQAPAAQPGSVNPWQTAFQALSASLNTASPSQAPAAYSAYQTPTPQATMPANWGSTAFTAAPTYAPQASTQEQQYSKQTVLALLAHQRKQLTEELSKGQTDAYLSQISDLSLEVLEHFGAEAPALLNQYACAVEDALIEQVKRGQSMSLLLKAAGEERGAMNLMLTNPDVLADYVNEFFGPNGPYPTMTKEEKQQAAQRQRRAQYEKEMKAYERNAVPANFQRPQMNMPTPSAAAKAAGNFWGGFGELMDNNPENAWKYLAQAPQGALQTKMLVQDL